MDTGHLNIPLSEYLEWEHSKGYFESGILSGENSPYKNRAIFSLRFTYSITIMTFTEE